MKRISITVWFIVLAGCEQSDSPNGNPPPRGYVQVQSDSPPHWLMASLDQELDLVAVTTLREYEAAFNALDLKCADSRSEIADYVQFAVARLQKKGTNVSRLAFLRALADSLPSEIDAPIDCKAAATMVWTMLERGTIVL